MEDQKELPQLTLLQKRFIKYYLEDPSNAAEAARRAGYSPKSAKDIACQLLNHSKLLAHLEKAAESCEYDYGLEPDEIKRKLTDLAEINIFDVIEIKGRERVMVKNINDIPHEYGQFIKRIKANDFGVEIEFYDKIKCLDMLAKMKGLYSDVDLNIKMPEGFQVVQHEEKVEEDSPIQKAD